MSKVCNLIFKEIHPQKNLSKIKTPLRTTVSNEYIFGHFGSMSIIMYLYIYIIEYDRKEIFC